MICVVCARTEAETGMVCGPDRTRLPRMLDELVRRYIELGSETPLIDTPWTVTQHRPVLDDRGKPTYLDGKRVIRTTVEPGGDIAQTLPMANTTRSHTPRVTGSSEPASPVNLDAVDLTGPARAGSLGIRHRGDWASRGGDPDQIGHLSIATELDRFVTEWAADRERGEKPPIATVPVLAGWLRERTEWACDHSLGIDEFAATVRRIVGALRAAQGDLPARPEVMDRPCPACGYLTLIRRPGEDWIDCDRTECGRVYSADEYAAHLRGIAVAARGEGGSQRPVARSVMVDAA